MEQGYYTKDIMKVCKRLKKNTIALFFYFRRPPYVANVMDIQYHYTYSGCVLQSNSQDPTPLLYFRMRRALLN